MQKYEKFDRLWNIFEAGCPKDPKELTEEQPVWSNGIGLLAKDKELINDLADLFDCYATDAGVDVVLITGYFDPAEDECDGLVDSHTGFYYLERD